MFKRIRQQRKYRVGHKEKRTSEDKEKRTRKGYGERNPDSHITFFCPLSRTPYLFKAFFPQFAPSK